MTAPQLGDGCFAPNYPPVMYVLGTTGSAIMVMEIKWLHALSPGFEEPGRVWGVWSHLFPPLLSDFPSWCNSLDCCIPSSYKGEKKSNWFLEQISLFIVLSSSPSVTLKVIMQPFQNVTVTYEVMPLCTQAGLGAARLSSAISSELGASTRLPSILQGNRGFQSPDGMPW